MASKRRKTPDDSKINSGGGGGESAAQVPIPDDLLLVAFRSTCANLGLDPSTSISRLSELLAAGASQNPTKLQGQGTVDGPGHASSKPETAYPDVNKCNEDTQEREATETAECTDLKIRNSKSVDRKLEDSGGVSVGTASTKLPAPLHRSDGSNTQAPSVSCTPFPGTSGYWVRDADLKKRWVSAEEADELYEKKYASQADASEESSVPLVIQIPDDVSPVKVEDFFIGRKVRKLFDSGYFNGVVIKYKPKKKFYLIRYEDDDEEEMDEAELNEFLVDDEEIVERVDDDEDPSGVVVVEDAEDKEDEAGSEKLSTEEDSDEHEEEVVSDAEKRKEEAKKNRQQKLKGRKNSKHTGGSTSDSEFELEEEEEEEEVSTDDESDEDFVAERLLKPARKDSHKIIALVKRTTDGDDTSKTKASSIEEDEPESSDDAAVKKSSKRKAKNSESSDSGSGRGRRGGRAKTRSKRGNRKEESDEELDEPLSKKRTRNSRKSSNSKKSRGRKAASDSESGSAASDVKKSSKGHRARPVDSDSEAEASESDSKSVEVVSGPRRKRIRKDEELSEAQKRAAKEGLEADRRRVLQRDLPEEMLRCLPETITQHLQDHQREGLLFMWNNVQEQQESKERGCILAHCMGLGKTLQVVALCQAFLQLRGQLSDAKKKAGGSELAAASPGKSKSGHKAKGDAEPACTVLILGPVNTLLNWVSEFSKWLPIDDESDRDSWARRSPSRVGGLHYPAVYLMADTGSRIKDQLELLEEWTETGGILLMGYEQYRNVTGLKGRTAKSKSDKEAFRRTLVSPGPQMVICDEGHVLRNAKSGLSMALAEIETRRRVVLTGTPLQNNLREYHCMINFVRPGLLKTEREFVRDFVSPILNGQCVDSTPADVKRMKFRISVLGKILKGVVDRKDYSVLKAYLPPKYEYVIAVRLSRLQAQLYIRYLEFIGAREVVQAAGSAPPEAAAALLAKPRALVFEAFHNLARVWTHPGVLEMERTTDVRARGGGGGGGGGRGRGGYTSLDDFIASSEDEDDWSDEEEKRKRRRRQQLKKAKERKAKQAVEEQDSADEPAEPEPTAAAAAAGGGGGESWWGPLLRKVAVTPKALGASCVEPFEEGTSGKLLFLMEVLARARELGEKVLVFTQSLLMIELIERCLEGLDGGIWKLGSTYFRLDGSTDKDTRKAWIDRFNEHARARLFLISTRAGGLGVNLVAANRVVIMDASWNPSHDHQAVFRAYRFGQTKPVYIYRLVAHGTMEEKVYNRQITKQDLASRVVDKDKDEQIGRYFTDEDLRRLYEFDCEGKTAEDFTDAAADAGSAAAAAASDGGSAPAAAKKMFSYIGLPTKDDTLLSGILRKFKPRWIVGYHPTDSLVDENDAKLTEEEEQAAWADYERIEAAEEQARVAAKAAERQHRALVAQARLQPAGAPRAGPVRIGDRPPMSAYELQLQQLGIQRQLLQRHAAGMSGLADFDRAAGGLQLAMPQIRMLNPQQQEQYQLFQQQQRDEMLRQQMQILQRQQLMQQQEQQLQLQQQQQYMLYQQQRAQAAKPGAAAGPAGPAGGAAAWSEAQLSAMPTALARPAVFEPPAAAPP